MNSIAIIVIISVLGPVLGSLLGIVKRPTDKFVYNLLSFSAGVMLSVSFLELIPQSVKFSSPYICALGIAIGSALMYLIDKAIPHIHPQVESQEQGRNLQKTALFLVIGMFIHHFPEGMAIAVGNVAEFKFSLTIALAIAIHDIPEGLSTASTYYHNSQKRLKSFIVSSVTTVPTLLGFAFANVLYKSISVQVISAITAATAGLMIYICADELIPTSMSNSEDHSTIFSLIVGILVVVLLGAI
jgi:ZIP family zinc transporter